MLAFVRIVRDAWQNPLNQTLVTVGFEIARSVNKDVFFNQPRFRRANVMFLRTIDYRHDEVAY